MEMIQCDKKYKNSSIALAKRKCTRARQTTAVLLLICARKCCTFAMKLCDVFDLLPLSLDLLLLTRNKLYLKNK